MLGTGLPAVAVGQDETLARALEASAVADSARQRNDLPAARLWYAIAAALYGEAGQPVAAAATTITLAGTFTRPAMGDSGFVSLRAGLAQARGAASPDAEAVLILAVGLRYERAGGPDSALGYFRQASQVAEPVMGVDIALRAGLGMARAFLNLGLPDSARAILAPLQGRARDQPDHREVGRILVRLARSYSPAQPESVLAVTAQALAAFGRAGGDPLGEGQALLWRGMSLKSLGRPDSALASLHRAQELFRGAGAVGDEIAAWTAIADQYLRLGRRQLVLQYAREALRLTQSRPQYAAQEAGVALLVARVHEDDPGRADSVVALLHHALTIYRRLGGRDSQPALRTLEAGVLILLSNHFREHRQPDSALGYGRAALSRTGAIPDRRQEFNARDAVALAFERQGRYDSALVYHRANRALAPAGEKSQIPEALGGIGRALLGRSYATGSRPLADTAASYFDSATTMLAEARRAVGDDQDRLGFIEQTNGLHFNWAIAILQGTGPDAALRSLAAVERGRAQALLQLMEGAPEALRPGADLAALGTRLTTDASAPDAVLLSYASRWDRLIVWVSAGPTGGAWTAVSLQLSEDSLGALVRGFRQALGVGAGPERGAGGRSLAALVDPVRAGAAGATGATGAGSPAALQALASMLSAAVFPDIVRQRLGPGIREVVIVPHGALAELPFAALTLPADTVPFGVRIAVRYSPSLATLGVLAERPGLPRGALRAGALGQALVVGNPVMPELMLADGTSGTLTPLPGAEAEGRAVAAVLGANPLTGAAAAEGVVRRRMAAAPVIHLATHGMAYSGEAQARQSFVALAPDRSHDGLLSVGEILDDPDLRLNAELVVLSACQTGLGELRQAEGSLGLQRAFLARGARSMLVSLWNVSDAATELLMRRFYAHWLEDRDRPGKSESLRRAQGDLRAQPAFREPKFWAAFQLVGAP